MEHEESGWILEFLVRQPSIDDKTINNLIGVLPIPNNNNLRFKKTLILRKLEKGTIFQLLGPPFLELACEMILSDDGLRKIMGLDDDGGGNGGVGVDVGREVDVNDKRKGTGGVGFDTRVEDGAKNVVGRDVDVNDKRKGNDALRTRVLPIHKQVSRRRPRGLGPHRGAKIVDPMETSHKNYDSIPTPVVNKVQALETSLKELHAVVTDTDPLLDALCLAESFKASKSGENIAHDRVVDNSTRVTDEAPSSSHDRKGKALEANGDDGLCGNQNKRRKPNLMERNDTAHSVEWNDSIDTSEEESPRRPHLPSPKRRAVSPLNIYKMGKLAMRRERKKWTPLEEDTLRAGVKLHGKGNWKLILNSYRDIFEDRTEVDLKDK